jgi:hypothetical protein
MQRPQDGTMLLNLAALDALGQELTRLAVRPISPIPAPEPEATATPAVNTTPAADAAVARAVGTPTATPPPRVVAPTVNNVAHTRALMVWFKVPLQHWLTERRNAAAYLDAAGNALRQPILHTAGDSFRQSISELQMAAAALSPTDAFTTEGTTLSDDARRRLETAATHIKAARTAEANAVAAMTAVG